MRVHESVLLLLCVYVRERQVAEKWPAPPVHVCFLCVRVRGRHTTRALSCVCVCVRARARVCTCVCKFMCVCVCMLSYVVINSFLCETVICLNTFFFKCIIMTYSELSYISFEFYLFYMLF